MSAIKEFGVYSVEIPVTPGMLDGSKYVSAVHMGDKPRRQRERGQQLAVLDLRSLKESARSPSAALSCFQLNGLPHGLPGPPAVTGVVVGAGEPVPASPIVRRVLDFGTHTVE